MSKDNRPLGVVILLAVALTIIAAAAKVVRDDWPRIEREMFRGLSPEARRAVSDRDRFVPAVEQRGLGIASPAERETASRDVAVKAVAKGH